MNNFLFAFEVLVFWDFSELKFGPFCLLDFAQGSLGFGFRRRPEVFPRSASEEVQGRGGRKGAASTCRFS